MVMLRSRVSWAGVKQYATSCDLTYVSLAKTGSSAGATVSAPAASSSSVAPQPMLDGTLVISLLDSELGGGLIPAC